MTKHCCVAFGPDLSLRSVSSFFPSGCHVIFRIFRENFPNVEAKSSCLFHEVWRLAYPVSLYMGFCCSKYQKSQGISWILGAKYFKLMRFCWNAWIAGVSRIGWGECECLPSQVFRSTREKLLPCTKRCHEPWDGSCRFSLEILVGKSMAW